MKKALSTVALLTVTATSAFAFLQNAPQNDKAAVHQSGLHSFAMVPANGSSRVPQFDYHRSTSEYPFGPGSTFLIRTAHMAIPITGSALWRASRLQRSRANIVALTVTPLFDILQFGPSPQATECNWGNCANSSHFSTQPLNKARVVSRS